MKMTKWVSEERRENVNVVFLLRFGNRREDSVNASVEDTVRVRVGAAMGKARHHFAN